jgi:hypothetical protein
MTEAHQIHAHVLGRVLRRKRLLEHAPAHDYLFPCASFPA